MAWTQLDIDALDTALKTGTLSVRDSDGKMVTYRSVDEIIKVRAIAYAALNGATLGPASRRPALAVWN